MAQIIKDPNAEATRTEEPAKTEENPNKSPKSTIVYQETTVLWQAFNCLDLKEKR